MTVKAMAPDTDTETGSIEIPPKQAVVIIHGMGEQRPMDTLRSFVRAVWQSDKDIREIPDAALGPEKVRERSIEPSDGDGAGVSADGDFYPSFEGQTSAGFKPKRAWMAPDTRTGSYELHRMTTGMSEERYRVDFYELYWADIMQGTTWSHLKTWLTGLLLRWPYQVPDDVRSLWYLLWISTAFLFAVAVTAAPNLAALFGFGELLKDVSFLPDGLSVWLNYELGSFITGQGRTWLFLVVLMGIVSWAILKMRALDRIAAAEKIWPPRRIFISKLSALFLALLIGWVVSRYFHLVYEMTLKGVLSLLAVVVIFGVNSFLLPYFGDVARYVQASPENVAKRGQVRERGMKLLRALHDLDKDGKHNGDKPTYGRIVLVGHSLGSIVAYDLLMQFWAEAGPLAKGLEGALKTEVEDMEAYLESARRSGTFKLSEFQDKQHAVMKAMRTSGEAFRITDLVTLGSPLTHAEFLVTRDSYRFQSLVGERLLSKAPPFPYEGGKETVSYLTTMSEGVETRMIHHAAPFAAVRWTNIYDKRQWILGGDLVSGPLRENFGEGISDRRVRIHRALPAVFARIFTHTLYWDVNSSGGEVAETSGHPEKAEGRLTHVGLVREAIRLRAYHEFYPRGSRQMGSHETAQAGQMPPAESVAFA